MGNKKTVIDVLNRHKELRKKYTNIGEWEIIIWRSNQCIYSKQFDNINFDTDIEIYYHYDYLEFSVSGVLEFYID